VFLSRLRKAFPDTTVVSLDLVSNPGDTAGNGKFNFRLRWHAAPRPILAAK
jgi:hypothetical protein